MGKESLDVDRHHRRPRSIGGDNSSKNISIVSRKLHRAWHALFDNFDVWTITSIINSTWLDARYGLVVVRRKHLERAQRVALALEKREHRREKAKRKARKNKN